MASKISNQQSQDNKVLRGVEVPLPTYEEATVIESVQVPIQASTSATCAAETAKVGERAETAEARRRREAENADIWEVFYNAIVFGAEAADRCRQIRTQIAVFLFSWLLFTAVWFELPNEVVIKFLTALFLMWTSMPFIIHCLPFLFTVLLFIGCVPVALIVMPFVAFYDCLVPSKTPSFKTTVKHRTTV